MHEMSLAEALIEQILDVAAKQGFLVVREVEIEVGVLQQIVPEVMEIAFRAASRGTLAEGAKLTLFPVKALAECRSCRVHFEPKPEDYRCPSCQVAHVRVLAGNDMILKSILGR